MRQQSFLNGPFISSIVAAETKSLNIKPYKKVNGTDLFAVVPSLIANLLKAVFSARLTVLKSNAKNKLRVKNYAEPFRERDLSK